MANRLQGLFSTPEESRNEYLSSLLTTPQQRASQGLLQQVVSLMGNAGANLGYNLSSMAGRTTPDRPEETEGVLQSVSRIASPIKRAQTASELFSKLGMTSQAQVMNKEIERLMSAEVEQQQARADIAKTEADTVKANTTKPSSVADERAAKLVAEVEQALVNGEEVDPTKLSLAKASFQRLIKQPLYQLDKTGTSFLTREGTTPATWAPLLARMMNGQSAPTTMPQGVTQGGTQPIAPTSQQQGGGVPGQGQVGSTILSAPAFDNKMKEIEQAKSSMGQLDQIINLGGNILNMYDKWGKDGLSPLNPNPLMQRVMGEFSSVTRSRDAYQASIDAAKAIETIIEMKRSSPTGSTGFGALSNQELATAQNMFSKLDPTADSYELDLAEYLNHVRGLKRKMTDDINKQEEKLGLREKTQDYTAIVDNAVKLNPGVPRAAIIAELRKKGWIK
jgi:hypothetical protein